MTNIQPIFAALAHLNEEIKKLTEEGCYDVRATIFPIEAIGVPARPVINIEIYKKVFVDG
jgi:hypothetical protein